MCGIIGIMGQSAINQDLYDGLTLLQHRGQDAAGMVTCHQDRFHLRKDNGLVHEVIRTRHMLKLVGNFGIGHVRYPTAGSTSSSEAQPFYVNSPYGIALAHNGNLTNAAELKASLLSSDRRHLNTDSDSELLLNVFAHELAAVVDHTLQAHHIFTAIAALHKRVQGAYAAVVMIAGYGIVAFRDPYGIRPLCFGQRISTQQNPAIDYMVASESIALNGTGFEYIRDIAAGEALFITTDGQLHTQQCARHPKLTPCIFEHVYFARPDSVMDGVSIHKARQQMGTKLAEKILKEWPDHDIDVIVPIPDTSRTSALAMAARMKVRFTEGLIRNRYIARTFIMPGQTVRKKSVRQKLNPINEELVGKNVLLVDDSIVRGTTSEEIVRMTREAGARKVYLASAAPAVRYANVYGIDMPSPKELIAHQRTTEQICAAIGADRLIYQDLGDLEQAVRECNPKLIDFDVSCFTGQYITGDVHVDYLSAVAHQRADTAKQTGEGSIVDLHNDM